MSCDDDTETTPLMSQSAMEGNSNSTKATVIGSRTLSETTASDANAPSSKDISDPEKFGKARAAVAGTMASLVYIGLSSSMILFNKFLMRDYVFPFPVALATLHMCCTLFLAFCLQRLCPSLFPAYSRIFGKQCSELEHSLACEGKASPMMQTMRSTMNALLPFAPIAICSATTLIAGNSAYRYASVSFLQMVKESHIMFVYILMLLAGLDKFKMRVALVIAFVSCSAMVAVYGEIYFSWQGLLLQLLSGLCGSSQIVLNNLLMSRSSMGKIDPLTLVFCTAPVMLVAMLPANFIFWNSSIVPLLRQWLPYIVGNALLAFALQISAATLIWVTSGTGYSLACVVKDLAIVAAAQVLLHESFTAVQVLGFAGSITGICIYSMMKLFPEMFAPASEREI